jgi:hypothetical protein
MTEHPLSRAGCFQKMAIGLFANFATGKFNV